MPTVYEIVTPNVIEQLEKGVAPWRKPWTASLPRNLISKRPYRGPNVFTLTSAGYGSPYWLTFQQAKRLRAHVRQGEKSSLVSFWNFDEYAKEDPATHELVFNFIAFVNVTVKRCASKPKYFLAVSSADLPVPLWSARCGSR